MYLLPCQQYSSHLPVLAQCLYVIIKIMKGVITAGTLVIKNIIIPSVSVKLDTYSQQFLSPLPLAYSLYVIIIVTI